MVVIASVARVAAQDDTDEFTFGACQPGRERCTECYLTLAKSLLGNDDNVFNLSSVFTAGSHDTPSFVIVTYQFQFENESKDETWIWAETRTYFLYPPRVFQYISLFFGNPKSYYQYDVYLSLNGTECFGVEDKHMRLLTQRVGNYQGIISVQLLCYIRE